MEWSNSGDFLAVAGSKPVEIVNESGMITKEYYNCLHFYNHQGVRIVSIKIPCSQVDMIVHWKFF